jgi:AmiR/NasT family two-component response regulator
MAPQAVGSRHVLLSLDGLDSSVSEEMATQTGWRVTRAPDDDAGFLESYRQWSPDVVVAPVDVFLRLRDALDSIRKRPFVCIGPDDFSAASAAFAQGAAAWVMTTSSVDMLATQAECATRWFERVEAVAKEKQTLAQTLETRKLVDRAKAIFMRRMNVDEPTAHKRLQQESQNRRVALADIARQIIESDELLKDDANTPASA